MQPASFDSTWEIRFGTDNRFRVLYDIDQEEREVHILAIGVKVSHRLVVGGVEMELAVSIGHDVRPPGPGTPW
jgi:hypothetical protein